MEKKVGKIPIIVVVGPTSCGKTELAIELAKAFSGEIVSADSMQIYKEFHILTAKPSKSQLSMVKHHMIDIISVKENFSVADYVKMAGQIIPEITGKNKMPILVGGTGLYVDSLLKGTDFDGDKNDYNVVRQALYNRIEQGEDLYSELIKVDPKSAERIHKNDTKRVVRALEFYRVNGYSISVQTENSKHTNSLYSPIIIGLNFKDRGLLYNNINKRVDNMLKSGLIQEVREISRIDIGNTASCPIGYKEVLPFLEGTDSLEDVVENVKRETRRYAKRQLTWFRRNKQVNWLYIDDYNSFEELACDAVGIVKKGGIT